MINDNNKNNEVAYLIQAYADSSAFKELVNVLLEMDNCHIFVHLDKKSDISKFYVEHSNVHFIDNREFVSWAGYKQGKLIFNLIDAALKYPLKFRYYCFLSESDFPVYSGKKLIEKIEQAKSIFINCSELQKNKVERYWFYDFGIQSVKLNKIVSKLVNGFFGILYKLNICKKQKQVEIDGKKVDVYCSGPFWRYNYEQLCYLNEKFKTNKKFKKYFKTSFAACELLVPTIIANSKYVDEWVCADKYINLNEISSLCFFKYTGPRVDVLSEKDYADIISSGKPFIRKVKKDQSEHLIKMIKNSWQ